MHKKWPLIIAAILLLFIILNPSMKQFKEYMGKGTSSLFEYRRASNFLIYSIYEYEYGFENKKYIGILSNFILLKPTNHNQPVQEGIDSVRIADSIKVEDLIDTSNTPPFLKK